MEVTSKEGLLWHNGKVIPLPEADAVAKQHGFVYAEELVKHLAAQPHCTLVDVTNPNPAE